MRDVFCKHGLRLVGLLLGVTGIVAQVASQQASTDDGLTVTLKPAVTTGETVVQLGAVADLKGGSASMRRKLAELDLAEVTPGGGTLTIGSEQVSFRLQIAGIEPRAFRIEGRQVVVTPAAQEISEESVLAAARQRVRRQLPKFADNVSIVPIERVRLPELKIEPADRIRLTAELPPGCNPLGLVAVRVNIIRNGERAAEVPVILNVSYIQRVSAADIDAEADNPILVKSHDMVRLVAKIGSIRVVALGEALQEGRRGELVRVRNVDSGKTVAGRVAEAQVVEVEY